VNAEDLEAARAFVELHLYRRKLCKELEALERHMDAAGSLLKERRRTMGWSDLHVQMCEGTYRITITRVTGWPDAPEKEV